RSDVPGQAPAGTGGRGRPPDPQQHAALPAGKVHVDNRCRPHRHRSRHRGVVGTGRSGGTGSARRASLPRKQDRDSRDSRYPLAESLQAMLRAVLVTPLSGPLGGYGQAGADALALWANWHNERFRPRIEMTVFDAHPDPVAALNRASQVPPDLLFGPYGSGPTAAVAGAT